MKRGGIEGPVGPLLVLLALIFGLVAYLAIGNQHGNLEHEMEEYSPVSTENLMSSGFHEDYGTHESTDVKGRINAGFQRSHIHCFGFATYRMK